MIILQVMWFNAAFHSTGELVITGWKSRVHDLRMERTFFRDRQFRHHDVTVVYYATKLYN